MKKEMNDKINKYFKEWTANEKLAFKREDEWVGDMVKGFVSYCINEENNIKQFPSNKLLKSWSKED